MTKNKVIVPYRWTAPSDVEYYPYVNLCGNIIERTPILIELVHGVQPIILAKGIVPRVWISAPTDISRKIWKFVVNDSVAVHPAFKVWKVDNVTSISVDGHTLLTVRGDGPDAASVIAINLKPIGLNVVGDRNSLNIGTTTLENNRIVGGHSVFKFG